MALLLETGRGDGSTEETSDQKTLSPQGEKTAVQKQTFTRWMNVFLKRCDPPVEVQDLFLDIRDGKALMALLEELSGCKLMYRFRPSSHRIFRLNNIAKALAFLDDRHVKLLGIDASAVADGVPRVVLQLIWNIISFFQIKEATGGLQRRLSSSLSSLSTSSSPSSRDLSPSPGDTGSYSSCTLPTKRKRPAREPRFRWKPIKTLLLWVQRRTSRLGVEVHDFGRSWTSGLAFLALIKSIDPGLVDLRDSLSREPQQNLEVAFRIAQDSLGIPALLEPQDVAHTSPDERSVVTYLSMFLEYHSDADEDIAPDIGVRPQVPEIPDYAPAEPGGFGETLALRPEAEAFLHSLGETSEQLLWKRWSRRSSGEPRPNLHLLRRMSSSQRTTGDSFSPQSSKKGLLRSGPSSGPANDKTSDASSWMEETSEGHHVFRSSHVDLCVDEGNFSQSSEEGLYSLSVLDSDEEDAYSYILDLHREHQQSDDPANGHPDPGPPEGTTDGGHIEGRHIEGRNTLKEEMWVTGSEVILEAARGEEDEGRGTKRRAGPRDEVREEKGGDERFKGNTTERLADDSVFREGNVWLTEEISEFRGRFGDGMRSSATSERSPGPVWDQSDGGDRTAAMPEDTGLVKHAEGEIKARVYHESINAKLHGGVASAVGVSLETYKDDALESDQTPVCRASSLCVFSEKEGAAASSCDVTGLELEVLFGLWMFLFCYFLFPQILL